MENNVQMDETAELRAVERKLDGKIRGDGDRHEVEVEVLKSGVGLRPTGGWSEAAVRGSLDLRESEDATLMAQLVEEPGDKLDEWGRGNRGGLIYYGWKPEMSAAVMGDRVLLKADSIESEYQCGECGGTGKTDDVCERCGGTGGVDRGDGMVEGCKACMILGYGKESAHPGGKKVCKSCRGIGWRNGIVLPEQVKQTPITGVVVSLGWECKWVKLGDRVLHSRYAGHVIEIGKETYRIVRETEVMCLLRDEKVRKEVAG